MTARRPYTVIVGAGGGLGTALTERFVQRGDFVIALCRQPGSLEDLRLRVRDEQSRLLLGLADVRVPGDIAGALKSLSVEADDVDTLVFNAGVKHKSRGFDPQLWRDTFATNAQGALWALEAVLPAMIARGRGRVLLVSSLGRWHAMAGTAGYNASKSALSIMGESIRLDLEAAGLGQITITVAEPGWLATSMDATKGSWLTSRLAIAPEAAADRIVDALDRKRRTCQFPWHTQLLTFSLAVLPSYLRARLLVRTHTPL